MIRLALSPLFAHTQPPPLYYCDKNDDEFFIFTPCKTEYRTCYKYNVKQDLFEPFANYDRIAEELHFECGMDGYHSHFIDPIQHKLCIFGGNERVLSSIQTISLDSDKSAWKLKKASTETFNNAGLAIAYWINEVVHCMDGYGHYYQYNGSNFDILCTLDDLYEPAFLYSSYHNMLYVMAKTSVWTLNAEQHENSVVFKETDIKLPRSMYFGEGKDCQSIMALNGILVIIFDFEEKWIYFMDLKREQKEWIKVEFEMFKEEDHDFESVAVMLTKNNDIHFINTYPKDELYHFKISLYQLLPNVILQKYITPLVLGYIRQNQCDMIPFDLVQLIYSFFCGLNKL